MSLSVFSFSPEPIDAHLVDLWVSGLSVGLASLRRLHEMQVADDAQLRELVELDTEDNFRLFEELRPSLEDPWSFRPLYDIAPSSRLLLSGKFYSFDDLVVRELLGRKLTSRARKDMDEVSEATGFLRPSCARQFDNLRRLFDACDETTFQVPKPHASMAGMLTSQFNLPLVLATRYSNILWLLYHRFNVHPSKKKNAFLDLASLEYCAEALRGAWCVERANGVEEDAFSPFEIDPQVIAKMKDIKTRLGAGGAANEVWAHCRAGLPWDASRTSRLEQRFRAWFRAVLNLASGVAQGKLRDLFEDVVLGLVEPLVEVPLSPEEAMVLFAHADAAVQLVAPDVAAGWQACTAGLRPCVVRCVTHHSTHLASASFDGRPSAMEDRRRESEEVGGAA
jgi:hypothetical protein